jgi:Zn-dependent protease
LHFSIFRVPVRVHPLFWLVGLLLGARAGDPIELVGWMIAFFVSILIHELGHAAAMRAYGFYPSITLYGLGGFTSYGESAYSRRPSGLSHIAISAAGPAAGFALVALLAGALMAAGFQVAYQFEFPPGLWIWVPKIVWSEAFRRLINQLFLVNIFWGILNLLPVYPLDGGQIAREVLVTIHPADGARWSLMISFVTAALIAVVALVQWQDVFGAILFGYLAYVSYATLAFFSGPGRWR